jgi:hypothetical protein
MSQTVVQIRFVDAQPAEAGQSAQELQEVLQEVAPKVEVRREPGRADTQGLGDTLLAILPHVPDALHISGTLALALLEGIHVWMLYKGHGAKPVELHGPQGAVARLEPSALHQVMDALQVAGSPPGGPKKS